MFEGGLARSFAHAGEFGLVGGEFGVEGGEFYVDGGDAGVDARDGGVEGGAGGFVAAAEEAIHFGRRWVIFFQVEERAGRGEGVVSWVIVCSWVGGRAREAFGAMVDNDG